ncbi:MAG: MarR family transcriptional regulator [Bacillaceae bacterium]|nr:MarR family transcriptional regulator [Bacillaceae bacterium]
MIHLENNSIHQMLNYFRATYKVVEEDWQKSAQEVGITQSEQHMLWIIYFGKKVSMSYIAKVGLWDLSTVMQVIKRLKAKGLVQTIKDENDLRVSYVMLTPEGEKKRAATSNFTYRFSEFLDNYANESEEQKQRLEESLHFVKDFCKYYYGQEFIQWVDQTSSVNEAENNNK